MTDRQHGGAGLPQPLLQRFDGQDVQVIGRLVQQQHVRVLREGPGQRRTPDLSA